METVNIMDLPTGRVGRYTLNHKDFGPYVMRSGDKFLIFWPGLVNADGTKKPVPQASFDYGIEHRNTWVLELLPVGTTITFNMDPDLWYMGGTASAAPFAKKVVYVHDIDAPECPDGVDKDKEKCVNCNKTWIFHNGYHCYVDGHNLDTFFETETTIYEEN